MARKRSEAKGKDGAKRKAASVIEQMDRELAGSALEKRKRGQQPTARERAALRRVERQREEEARWTYYESIPQKHWREMSGRTTQCLKNQEARYGLPFGGPSISLPKLAKALHDFLAKHARRLSTPETDEEMLSGGSSPALEKFRLARSKREELKLDEELGNLIPRDQVHDGLARIAKILRNAGDTLQKQCGPEAHKILEEALVEAEREGAEVFGASE